MDEPAGFVKVIAHAETDRILGVHMVGAGRLRADCTKAWWRWSSRARPRTWRASATRTRRCPKRCTRPRWRSTSARSTRRTEAGAASSRTTHGYAPIQDPEPPPSRRPARGDMGEPLVFGTRRATCLVSVSRTSSLSSDKALRCHYPPPSASTAAPAAAGIPSTPSRRAPSAPKWPGAASPWSMAAATSGLMGVVADAVLAGGGKVIGVIPRQLVELEVAHPGPERTGGGRDHAPAQDAHVRAVRSLRRPARRLRHDGRDVRDADLGPARPAPLPLRLPRRARLLPRLAHDDGAHGRRTLRASRTARQHLVRRRHVALFDWMQSYQGSYIPKWIDNSSVSA